ncbi:MAG: NAD-dependent epimerase [Usitatibacter sp.]
MKILVTGAAGFIGFHLSKRLLDRGDSVVGLDNLNTYYDISLKDARVNRLREAREFEFVRCGLEDRKAMEKVFAGERFDAIVNLAAQAGVRYSIENPYAYVEGNVAGFMNVLEGARRQETGHLVFASTSSIYGLNTGLPFDERQNTDHPMSLYAATKKANEAMAHSYAHLFRLPCTGLRFFTVYGPWGRPDMALFKFTKGIIAGEPIPVFNEGKMVRDFTYVDDIVEGVVRVVDRPAQPDVDWDAKDPDAATSSAPWRIYNIGNHQRVELMRYIRAIEDAVGKKAKLELLPMQAGDVAATEADTRALEQATGFKPATPVEEGVRKFVEWYRGYYKV